MINALEMINALQDEQAITEVLKRRRGEDIIRHRILNDDEIGGK